MKRAIDGFLRRISMNRLTAYLLGGILALAFILSFFEIVPGGPDGIASTTAILLASCVLANWGISKIKRIPVKSESSIVTALILALICGPVSVLSDPLQVLILALCGAAGIAAKHLLALRRQPVFNPAALAALISGLAFGRQATWWVGNIALLPLVAAGGLLLSYRVGRLRFIGGFFLAFFPFMAALGLFDSMSVEDLLQNAAFVLSRTSLFFLATFMLTDPKTSPKGLALQIAFLAVVALLYQPQVTLFGRGFTPEEALLVGNVLAFLTKKAIWERKNPAMLRS
jgi:Na+-translocating ferredoxin:NAD+ oxidoreductase RnfD subunit